MIVFLLSLSSGQADTAVTFTPCAETCCKRYEIGPPRDGITYNTYLGSTSAEVKQSHIVDYVDIQGNSNGNWFTQLINDNKEAVGVIMIQNADGSTHPRVVLSRNINEEIHFHECVDERAFEAGSTNTKHSLTECGCPDKFVCGDADAQLDITCADDTLDTTVMIIIFVSVFFVMAGGASAYIFRKRGRTGYTLAAKL